MNLRATALAALAAFSVGTLPALAADTIKIGEIVVTSGFLKGPGEPAKYAFDLAVEEINANGGINGKQIEVFRFDTGSDPKQAAVGLRTLAGDDKVLAILGPFSSGETRVALTMADRIGVLMIPTAASAPDLVKDSTWGWRLTEDESKQFSRLLAAMKDAGLPMKTAEIVYVSDEVVSATAGTKLYPALMEKAGIEVGEPIAVQYKSFDMSGQAAKIMESNPDLVAVAGLPDSASKVVKELRRQGYEGRIIGSQIFADPLITELFGPEGNGTMVVAGFWKGRTPQAQAFNDKLMARLAENGIHKVGAHHSDAQAYDGVYLLKKVMEQADVTGDPDKLEAERKAILDQMADVRFDGVVGDDICFDKNHDAELPGYVIEIKDQQWTKFAEAPADKCE